jgi:hypothetical protein
MGFFDKVKCLAGSHDLSSWAYESSDSCVQKRSCKRSGCDKSESQTTHNWPAFKYVSGNSCEQERQCSRCREKETQTTHGSWSKWAYLKPDECEMSRTCARCQQTAHQKEHQWDVWQYESPTSCTQVRFCRRCNETDLKRPETEDHRWEKPVRLGCRSVMTRCGRCKKEKFDSLLFPVHNWGEWRPNPYNDEFIRTCKECGAREEGTAT